MQHQLWVLAALCCSVLQEEPHTIDTIAISAVVTDYAANNSAANRQLGTTITAAFLACDAWLGHISTATVQLSAVQKLKSSP